MTRCVKCTHWRKDGNGGWGVCMNMMTAQDVEHWRYQKSLTFKTFGCVYAKKSSKETWLNNAACGVSALPSNTTGEEPKIRPLTPYAEAILKAIPFAPDDVPSWQLDTTNFFAGRRVAAALQQLKRRGLIVVSPRRTSSGKRWQRPNNAICVKPEEESKP